MSVSALLLRCLLIVTLCLDGSLSLWTASVTAVTQIQHAVAAGERTTQAALDEAADCEDEGRGQGAQSHEDCDCSSGGCECLCIFSIAAITHSVPFLAQHALTTKPTAWPPSHVPLSTRTPVFRPPIG